MDALNILAHETEKFGIVTVIDATVYDLASGEAILELDTLKVANFSTEMQEKIITGGQANDQLIIYNHSRTATLDLQDAIASMSSLEFLWGTDLVTSGVTEHKKEEAIAVTETTGSFDLSNGAVAGTKITITDGTLREVITAVDGITQTSLTFVAAEVVTVWYEMLADVQKALTLSSSSFASNVKIVGKTFLIDKADGSKKYAELVIHNYKLNPSFALAFDAAGDASVFDFSGTALIDSDGDVITLKYLTA